MTDTFHAIWLPWTGRRRTQECFYAVFASGTPQSIDWIVELMDRGDRCNEWQVLVLGVKHVTELSSVLINNCLSQIKQINKKEKERPPLDFFTSYVDMLKTAADA